MNLEQERVYGQVIIREQIIKEQAGAYRQTTLEHILKTLMSGVEIAKRTKDIDALLTVRDMYEFYRRGGVAIREFEEEFCWMYVEAMQHSYPAGYVGMY